MASDAIRSFIAVPIPNNIKSTLAAAFEETFGDIQHLRSVRPQGMHITLKFLGDLKKDLAHRIGASLGAIVWNRRPFAVQAVGIGGFPDLLNPRVLYTPLIGETQSLIDMAADLEKALAEFGIAPENKPFEPHLTLARVKTPKQLGLIRKRLKALKGVSFGEFRVEELILFRSDLRPEGAHYAPLASARLGVKK
jgi:RNA 2',3'-cyclic 3'-phosphodiesterase